MNGDGVSSDPIWASWMRLTCFFIYNYYNKDVLSYQIPYPIPYITQKESKISYTNWIINVIMVFIVVCIIYFIEMSLKK